MWMGTPPVLPSYVANTGEDLQDLLDRHSHELIGEHTINKFGHSKLPYLPKVLSIAKALPLQLHPDKDLASKVHQQKSDAFTDPNHKPEIAVALTEFEAFCSFKPLYRIAELMKLEPLYRFLPPTHNNTKFTDQALRDVVRAIVCSDDDTIKETYNFLIRISQDKYSTLDLCIPKLAPRLTKQYTESDSGILVALITMNYLVLQPGESIYIPADSIHAYLSGDIIESMARSNNVLNTGFCPRAERSNIDIFCDCLNFRPHSAEESMLKPKAYGKCGQGRTRVFAPPMSEFDMLETKLKAGETEVLKGVKGPSILLATRGSAKMKVKGKDYELKEGSVFFVAYDVEMAFEAGGDGLTTHIAVVD